MGNNENNILISSHVPGGANTCMARMYGLLHVLLCVAVVLVITNWSCSCVASFDSHL